MSLKEIRADTKAKRVSGYLNSEHKFGRSSILRFGGKEHYLRWQYKDKVILSMRPITKEHYKHIKSLLLGVKEKAEREISDKANTVVYRHTTDSKTYMRIKRYLVKEELI